MKLVPAEKVIVRQGVHCRDPCPPFSAIIFQIKKSIFNSILCISFNFQYLPSLALSSQRQLVIVCFYLIFSPKVLVSYLLRAHGAWVQLFSVYFNISNAIQFNLYPSVNRYIFDNYDLIFVKFTKC